MQSNGIIICFTSNKSDEKFKDFLTYYIFPWIHSFEHFIYFFIIIHSSKVGYGFGVNGWSLPYINI